MSNIIPFSKGNETAKEPLMRNVYSTSAPMPVEMAVSAMAQVEAQGWTVRHCLFAGQVRQSGITLAQQPVVSVYIVVCVKAFAEGTEVVKPVLDFGEEKK